MRRYSFLSIFILFIVSTFGFLTITSCDRLPDILASYPGLTLYFERATHPEPLPDVHATVVDYASAATSGADGKVTLRVPQQAASVQVHIEWTTLVPYETRTKDYSFSLGKGDNYYKVILQDDPRRPY